METKDHPTVNLKLKNSVCSALIATMLGTSLTACNNNVGGRLSPISKQKSAIQINESYHALASLREMSESGLDYRRDVFEKNDIIVFNAPTGSRRIVYLDSTHGLRVWESTDAVIPESIYDNDQAFRDFIKAHAGSFKTVVDSSGKVYQPDNSYSIVYDDKLATMRWVQFVSDTEWAELAWKISEPVTNIHILQKRALRDKQNTSNKSVSYIATGISDVNSIEVSFLAKNLTNQDGEIKEAIVSDYYSSPLLCESAALLSTNLKLATADENKPIATTAKTTPDYVFTGAITDSEKKFIKDNFKGTVGVDKAITAPTFVDWAVPVCITIASAILGFIGGHYLGKNIFKTKREEIISKISKVSNSQNELTKRLEIDLNKNPNTLSRQEDFIKYEPDDSRLNQQMSYENDGIFEITNDKYTTKKKFNHLFEEFKPGPRMIEMKLKEPYTFLSKNSDFVEALNGQKFNEIDYHFVAHEVKNGDFYIRLIYNENFHIQRMRRLMLGLIDEKDHEYTHNPDLYMFEKLINFIIAELKKTSTNLIIQNEQLVMALQKNAVLTKYDVNSLDEAKQKINELIPKGEKFNYAPDVIENYNKDLDTINIELTH